MPPPLQLILLAHARPPAGHFFFPAYETLSCFPVPPTPDPPAARWLALALLAGLLALAAAGVALFL